MSNEIKTIEGKDCYYIKPTPGKKPYQNTKEGSQNHGKSYFTYTYNGVAFVVHEDDEFNTLRTSGKLAEVRIGVTQDGDKFQYSLIGCLSTDQVLGSARFARELNVISNANFKMPESIEYEELG
jgi:hypothetical protein